MLSDGNVIVNGGIGECACQNRGLSGGLVVEFGEGFGGDVVDAVALDQPLFAVGLLAVVEGGEGDVAELSVGGIDDGLDVGLGEVGFDGFDQPVVEFLGGLGGVAAGVLQGLAEGEDGLVEFGFADVDGAAEGWGVGGGDDEFEAIVEDEGIEEGGVEGFEVVLQACEVFEGEALAEDVGFELVEEGGDGGAGGELIELLIEFGLQLEELINSVLFGC